MRSSAVTGQCTGTHGCGLKEDASTALSCVQARFSCAQVQLGTSPPRLPGGAGSSTPHAARRIRSPISTAPPTCAKLRGRGACHGAPVGCRRMRPARAHTGRASLHIHGAGCTRGRRRPRRGPDRAALREHAGHVTLARSRFVQLGGLDFTNDVVEQVVVGLDDEPIGTAHGHSDACSDQAPAQPTASSKATGRAIAVALWI